MAERLRAAQAQVAATSFLPCFRLLVGALWLAVLLRLHGEGVRLVQRQGHVRQRPQQVF